MIMFALGFLGGHPTAGVGGHPSRAERKELEKMTHLTGKVVTTQG